MKKTTPALMKPREPPRLVFFDIVPSPYARHRGSGRSGLKKGGVVLELKIHTLAWDEKEIAAEPSSPHGKFYF